MVFVSANEGFFWFESALERMTLSIEQQILRKKW